MKLNMTCVSKTLHHQGASGAVHMVQFGVDGGIGTLHLYLPEAEANQIPLGSKRIVSLESA